MPQHGIGRRNQRQIGHIDATHIVDQGSDQHVAIGKTDLELGVHHGPHAAFGYHQALARLELDDDVNTDHAHTLNVGDLEVDLDDLRHLQYLTGCALPLWGFGIRHVVIPLTMSDR